MMALMRERFTVPVLPEAEAGHARKLVTARSGGGVKVLDPVLEDNPRNDPWQALSAAVPRLGLAPMNKRRLVEYGCDRTGQDQGCAHHFQ